MRGNLCKSRVRDGVRRTRTRLRSRGGSSDRDRSFLLGRCVGQQQPVLRCDHQGNHDVHYNHNESQRDHLRHPHHLHRAHAIHSIPRFCLHSAAASRITQNLILAPSRTTLDPTCGDSPVDNIAHIWQSDRSLRDVGCHHNEALIRGKRLCVRHEMTVEIIGSIL